MKKFKALSDIQLPAPKPQHIFTVVGPFSLDWVFSFGKYRRTMRTLAQVIDDDPEYVLQCLENVAGFSISPGAHMALDESLSSYNCHDPGDADTEDDYRIDDDNEHS